MGQKIVDSSFYHHHCLSISRVCSWIQISVEI
jgi:hypothetical protein